MTTANIDRAGKAVIDALDAVRCEHTGRANDILADALDEKDVEIERLRAALIEIEAFTRDVPDDHWLSHVCGVARAALGQV